MAGRRRRSARGRRSGASDGSSKNRYAHLNEPDAVLDFHGQGALSGQEIKARTIAFIEQARAAGHARVRIVTGKGLHSRSGPVAKPQVMRTLEALEAEGRVRSFQEEALGGGGAGALRVDL